MSDEKTEAPTEKKLEDARRDGEVPKSTDLAAGALLIASALVFASAGPNMGQHLRAMMHIGTDVTRVSSGEFSPYAVILDIGKQAALMLLPVMGVALLVPVCALLLQTGVNISFKPVELKLSAINPGAGLKRIFSVRSAIDLVKMLIKAGVLISVLYEAALGLIPMVATIGYQPMMTVVQVSWVMIWRFIAVAGVAYIVLGAADYGIQRWLFIRDHRMSKDEIKRESKESEGDPEIKGKRKQIARDDAEEAAAKGVDGAQVIVTNPTHYAVALRYAPEEHGLPRIIAKGVDSDALAIRKAGEASGIPVVENPPLARALYTVPLQDAVPNALLESVAEILVWASQLNHNDRKI
jgi:type III secretion protein U